jgi:hypothetical protein
VAFAVVVEVWSVEASEEIVYGYPAVQTLCSTVYDLEVGIAIWEEEGRVLTGVLTGSGEYGRLLSRG